MFENPRRGRQARNFTTNAPKILDLKSSSEQIFSRKLPLGAPATCGPVLACVAGGIHGAWLLSIFASGETFAARENPVCHISY